MLIFNFFKEIINLFLQNYCIYEINNRALHYQLTTTIKSNTMNTIIANNIKELRNLPFQIENSILRKALELKRQINYFEAEIAPFLSEMEQWEAKEYASSNLANQSELDEIISFVLQSEAVFNELLYEAKMRMSIVVFIVKFLK